jgi:glycosyltransferase involved in cell wall biosynthesis
VARTVTASAARARRRGLPLAVIASLPVAPVADFELENFPPIWSRALPGYEELTLAVPPFVELVEYLERERFAEVLISTPGPVGLAALAGAKLLGLPVAGIYHTDFPRFVAAAGGGESLTRATAAYLGWFYGQMDRVLVTSAAYRAELVRLGIEPARLERLPRGVDADLFHPARRRPEFFARFGLDPGVVFLYVGRLAPEKNLEALLATFDAVAGRDPRVRLALVGDGPSRPALERAARGAVAFCGYLDGEELAAAYASADVFVFPSRTDTFGNAVLEAMASGLPAIVAAEGGPAELARASEAAVVADVADLDSFGLAMEGLAAGAELRSTLGRRARAFAERQTWDATLDALVPLRAPAATAPATVEAAVAGG